MALHQDTFLFNFIDTNVYTVSIPGGGLAERTPMNDTPIYTPILKVSFSKDTFSLAYSWDSM